MGLRRKEWVIGDQTFHRKNLYTPCVIGERFDAMTDEEKVAAYKATWWADNITAAEWPVVLGKPEASKTNRSRLKKKMVGWFMAMGRIGALNPELFHQAFEEARRLYLEQIGEPNPILEPAKDDPAAEASRPGSDTRRKP
jgi:hypothetical protein